jgi:hypothetical protein
MPQSDGANTLKRMEFEFKGNSYVFNLNPEEYSQGEISRSTVTQTKGGAFIDSFGAGLPTLFIKGTTGFKGGVGVTKFKELRKLIRDYVNNGEPGKTITDELVFHNYTDEESWVVHTDPNAFKLMRSKSNPLMFMYEINLVCIRPATYPGETTDSVKGGVGVTLGSPLSKDEIADAVDAQVLAYNKIVGALNFNTSLIPDNTVTSIVSKTRVLSDGQVQDFTPVAASTESSQMNTSFEPVVSQLAVETSREIQKVLKTQSTEGVSGDFVDSLVSVQNQFIPNNLLTAVRTVLLEYYTIALNSRNGKISSGYPEKY